MLICLVHTIGFFSCFAGTFAPSDSTTITVSVGAEVDSVSIKYVPEFWSIYNMSVKQQQSFKKGATGIMKIAEISTPGYIVAYLFTSKDDLVNTLPLNPGDRVAITFDKGKIVFSGSGAKKMEIAYGLDTLERLLERKYYDSEATFPIPLKYSSDPFLKSTYRFFNKPLDSLLKVKINYLDRFRKTLSEQDYLGQKANIVFNDYRKRFSKFAKSNAYSQLPDSIKQPLFKELFKEHLYHLGVPSFPDAIVASCFSSFYYYYHQWKFRSIFWPTENPDILEYANGFTKRYRDKFLFDYILLVGTNSVPEALYNKVLGTLSEGYYKNTLIAYKNGSAIGAPAFNFTLEDMQRKTIRLEDFKGKVVFMDFWFTGCMWCKQYYKTLSEVEEHFKRNDKIVFLSVCIDQNRDKWLESVRSHEYSDPSGINLYTQGVGTKHPLIEHYFINGYPTQLIIDQYGNNYNINDGVQKLDVTDHIQYLQNIIDHVPSKANSVEAIIAQGGKSESK